MQAFVTIRVDSIYSDFLDPLLSIIWNYQLLTGPVKLAAVGVSIAIFNQVSRIAIFPLVSVTTSFVAEENAKNIEKGSLLDGEMKELGPRVGV